MEKGISTNDYNEMLREIIAEVKITRVVVANRLSATVTKLYWNIGKRLASEKIGKGLWRKSRIATVGRFKKLISR
jgi:hypothetical protein